MSREAAQRAAHVPVAAPTVWRVAKDLARVEANTVGRMARVQGEAAVQNEKLVEIDRMARTAMSGQAMLSAAGDAFVELSPVRADEVRQHVLEHIEVTKRLNEKEVNRQHQRLTRLKAERKKLLEAHYADAISIELLREEQTRITSEEAAAQRVLDSCELRFDVIKKNLRAALKLAVDSRPTKSADP